jgi:hypothetical protein
VYFVDELGGLLQVQDVDPIALGVDELRHLGIPFARGMTEVDAAFQQLT